VGYRVEGSCTLFLFMCCLFAMSSIVYMYDGVVAQGRQFGLLYCSVLRGSGRYNALSWLMIVAFLRMFLIKV